MNQNPHPCKKCCKHRTEFKRIAKEHAVTQLALSVILTKKQREYVEKALYDKKRP
jgi:hypothetical protein